MGAAGGAEGETEGGGACGGACGGGHIWDQKRGTRGLKGSGEEREGAEIYKALELEGSG